MSLVRAARMRFHPLGAASAATGRSYGSKIRAQILGLSFHDAMRQITGQ